MPALTERNYEARRTRIGASELGALEGLGGLHPWTDEARIYARIVDGVQPDQTSSMSIGHDLEHVIAHLAAGRLGLDALACRHTYVHPALPIAATPDYYVRERRQMVGGIAPIRAGAYPGLLEVKVSNEWSWWTDGPPPWTVWQVRAQLALSHRTWAVVAVLIGGRIETYELDHDPAEWRRVLDAVETFQREHLDPHIPPGTTDERLVLRWTLAPGERVAGPEAEKVGEAYMRAVAMRRWAEAQEKTARAQFVPMFAATGARVMVGSGWSAAADAQGNMRFNVSRKGLTA
jgi:predicted phage-related endonuclease